MKNKKVGIVKAFKLLWKFMSTKERCVFVGCILFSPVSALAWMFINLIPALVLASLIGEPVILFFIDLSMFSTVEVLFLLLAVDFVLWAIAMTHYYIICMFSHKMICDVNMKAQNLILADRANLDFGMTNGEINYIIESATQSVHGLIEPVCWNVITNVLAVGINIGVLFSLDYIVGIVAVGMVAVISLIAFARIKLRGPLVSEVENTNAKIDNHMLTSVQNLPLITMLQSQLEERHQLGILNKKFYRLHKKQEGIMFWYWIAIIAVEFGAIGIAVWLFITRNGTTQAVSSITMIFTILGDIQSTIEDWGWQLADIQASAIKLCNLTKLNPTKSSIKAAVSRNALQLYDESIKQLEVLDVAVRLGKFKKTYRANFESGKVYLLSGQSGCGKTTFINSICGLREIKTGQIRVNDKYAISSLKAFSSKISYMFQDSILFDRSIKENIAYPKLTLNEESSRLIRKFNMTRLINREQEGKNVRNSLSGGEKKRIDFIRAISRKADIYFLDEPTNELDAKNVTKVIDEINRLKKQEKIVVIISHDKRVEDIADEVVNI